jgi:hypothetical protein
MCANVRGPYLRQPPTILGRALDASFDMCTNSIHVMEDTAEDENM